MYVKLSTDYGYAIENDWKKKYCIEQNLLP